MKADLKICPTCGNREVAYLVSLRPGIIHALIKFRQAVQLHKRNKIHLLKDMRGLGFELTPHEWNNFSRLRFHGLVAKYKEEGKHTAGYWLLTHRGSKFLDDKVSIPRTVKVSKNRVIDRSDDLVSVKDILGSVPFFDKLEDIIYEEAEL